MENAADALKMAFGVLVFVMALSITILSFGEVRSTSDIILSYKDRENEYFYYEFDENDPYNQKSQNGKKRIVGIETLIPAIYRAKVENYRIVFEFKDSTFDLYKVRQGPKTGYKFESILFVDPTSKKSDLVTSEQKTKFNDFIAGILYHNFGSYTQNEFEEYFSVKLNSEPLYNKLKDMVFTEDLGEYNQSGTDIPEVQKTYKRVITYKQI